MSMSGIITAGATRMKTYTERLTKDLGEHNFARLPRWGMGGEVIKCNHPAWVYGHLAFYNTMFVGMFGVKTAYTVPATYENLYKNGSVCMDDPAGNIYPPMSQIMDLYNKSTDAFIAAVAKASEAELDKPTPDENARKHFATLGELALFMLNNHVAMHSGQVSTWRRAMALPPA